MNRLFFLIPSLLIALSVGFASFSPPSGKPSVLVFVKTAGFHHESIPDGILAIQKLGKANNFNVDTTTNPGKFNEDTLKKYAAVVFLSTTGDVLNQYQEAEFERYIQAGGGFVGIHAAADCEYDWGWYGRLVGGYFLDHPGINDKSPNVQVGIFQVVDSVNKATRHLPKPWKRTDEFYSYKKVNTAVHELLTIDEKSYEGGHKMGHHPMSWYHDYDGGRAFYTGLGHTKESFSEQPYLQHLLAGIQYAIGDNNGLDYAKAKTARVPDENRFSKTALVTGQFFEPTEMTILPNLDVLIAQRRGEIMLAKKGSSMLKQAGFLNVYYKTNAPGVNAEEGVLGLKADPNFEKNHHVFVFYSPADTSVNRLSRFTFVNDSLDLSTEKVVLQFYSQRDICCHTGGSVTFDKDGLLYLSTGDNTTPFNEPKQPHPNSGYAPIDDRSGHEQYDARRTSGNANDLRGKIIRIRVKNDGSYEIPAGNLYPKGQAGSRPEIFVQGNRNPYRISVDPKTSYLYWGEVGPDASKDSLGLRGPRGYDEVNQARKAGFFGWPLFIGKNFAYNEYDSKTGTFGKAFDPAKPVNTSRNNTGIQNLPPAQPAFIWYPYDASTDFPQVGTGGRNAMAGPVYYTDMHPKNTRLPDYYNGKLFIYDWIRGWIKTVTLQPNGDFDKMEPFMESTKYNSLIDMEVGPDGKLYLLEYGSGWFTKNPDAGLSRIDFNAGNRPPVVAGIVVNKTSGSLPLKVVARVTAKDLENDALSYEWHIGNGITKITKLPQLEYTFNKAGDYTMSVIVKDSKNAQSKSAPVSVYAGNEAPVVNIAIKGNQSFYFPDKPVAYSVSVHDKETHATTLTDVFVSADYVEGLDKAGASLGHQLVTESMAGKSLVQSMDCKTCHKETEMSIGPAYASVSQRYQKDPNAVSHLVNKIIKGGSGVWGETMMPAHPGLSEGNARQVVSWILSLNSVAQKQESLPANGTVKPTLDKKPTDTGLLVLSASYTDKGGIGIKPLTGNAMVTLRNSSVSMGTVQHLLGYTIQSFGGRQFFMVPKERASFSFDNIDMTGISGIDLRMSSNTSPEYGYVFELHLDSPTGRKVGEGTLAAGSKFNSGARAGYGSATVFVPIDTITDNKLHALYLVSRALNPAESQSLIFTSAEFKAEK